MSCETISTSYWLGILANQRPMSCTPLPVDIGMQPLLLLLANYLISQGTPQGKMCYPVHNLGQKGASWVVEHMLLSTQLMHFNIGNESSTWKLLVITKAWRTTLCFSMGDTFQNYKHSQLHLSFLKCSSNKLLELQEILSGQIRYEQLHHSSFFRHTHTHIII